MGTSSPHPFKMVKFTYVPTHDNVRYLVDELRLTTGRLALEEEGYYHLVVPEPIAASVFCQMVRFLREGRIAISFIVSYE